MIKSAEEFVRLRESEIQEEQHRASNDSAELEIWYEVIRKYPEFKEWVIHNKTIPIEILELLAEDKDPRVRSEVARKRKINDKIFSTLSIDQDENVRYALIFNTKFSKDKAKLKLIKVDDSAWLQEKLEEKMTE